MAYLYIQTPETKWVANGFWPIDGKRNFCLVPNEAKMPNF